MLVVLLLEQLFLLFSGERPHGHAQQVVVVRVPRVLLSIAVDVGIVVAAVVVLVLLQLKRKLIFQPRFWLKMVEQPNN